MTDTKFHAAEMSRRRALLKSAVLSGGAAIAGLFRTPFAQAGETPQEQAAQAAVERATRGMPAPKIRDVIVIEVPRGGLMVVKVLTDQDGLYGYGEAGLGVGGRGSLVRSAVEDYLKPLVMGRTTDRIEEIWQLCYLSSYYKNDQAQNSAISGVCDALWDIKGRQANMPVYQLVGGKCRDAAAVYRHANAPLVDPKQIVENAKKIIAEEKVVHIHTDIFYRDALTKTLDGKPAFDRDLILRKHLAAFEALRKAIPADIKLGCDMHSMVSTIQAVRFCRAAEQYGPWYFVEDPISPEDQGFLTELRKQTAIPLSIGELYNNPSEWRPVIEQRLVDYQRIHISHIGGFTAARKVQAYAENFQVKSAWHAAGMSPVGHMANLTLDVTTPNFGLHEVMPYNEQTKALFPGAREVRDGYAWISEKPGWGVELDEAAAAKLPPTTEAARENRLSDGSLFTGTGP